MNVRLAAQADIDQLIWMRWDFTYEGDPVRQADEELFQSFSEECCEFLADAIRSGRWYIWVVEVDDRIVSHMYIERIDKVPRPGKVTHPFAYMTNVYTLPTYRGQRIGASLLAAIEAWARQQHYEFILVWPSETSVTFYERGGYKRSPDAMELMLE